MTIHDIYAPVSGFFRRRRLEWLKRELCPRADDHLLDVGGYPWCWPENTSLPAITLLNLEFPPGLAERHLRFRFVLGDACQMPFADGEFEIAFSNSVIEHVGTWERQQQFAGEIRRVGRRIWVQTPAREFFIEPHLIAPFIHWLPVRWQRRLIRNFTLRGWLTRPGPADVDAHLAEVRLLKREEMQALFPDCEILTERFLGLAKSHIAVRRG